MPDRMPISEEEIAREFRLQRRLHVLSTPAKLYSCPALHTCLSVCAEIRKRREINSPPTSTPVDLKRIAAGDND
jgi:hypothetical protein